MSVKHTISINGQLYDAVSGLMIRDGEKVEPKPVAAPVKPGAPRPHTEPVHPSNTIHQKLQKSTTLRRGHLAAPKSKVPTSAPKRHVTGHVSRSPMISRFASHPQPFPKQHEPKMINDIGPVVRQNTPAKAQPLTSKEVKERLIASASNKLVAAQAQKPAAIAHHTKKAARIPLLKRLKSRHLIAAGAAILLVIGYVAYLNFPGVSVRLAASQAGVDARFPNYSPDGYSFQGPVAFQPGEVELQFKSNGGGAGYTIRESNSDWNSIAVRDNLVDKASNGEYTTTTMGGVTIYTYGTRAAWTNGGVLYQVEGAAPLSPDQLHHIASSM